MKVCVFTVDQRSSRTSDDLVPEAITQYAAGALLPFERTAGDEIQAVFTSPAAIASTLEALLRSEAWNVGLGLGEIDEPLPDSSRAGRGAAYLHARSAVTRAKNVSARVAVVGADDYRAHQLETVTWLWAALLSRRTAGGWEVADLVDEGLTHAQAAQRLGISQSAVSQRGQSAGLVEGTRARELVTQLLTEQLG